MAKLQIKRDVLEGTKERSNLTTEDKAAVERLLGPGGGKGAVTANLAEYPAAFLRALLDDSRLTPNQRAVVAMHVYGMSGNSIDRDQVYGTPVANPIEFGSTFVLLGGRSPNCELFLNGRWYPVTMAIQFIQERDHITKAVLLSGDLVFNHQPCGRARLRGAQPGHAEVELPRPGSGRANRHLAHHVGSGRLDAHGRLGRGAGRGGHQRPASPQLDPPSQDLVWRGRSDARADAGRPGVWVGMIGIIFSMARLSWFDG
jgi:hypothetical protein